MSAAPTRLASVVGGPAAWIGPLLLAGYYAVQFGPTAFAGIHGDVEWFWLTAAGAVALLAYRFVRGRLALSAIELMAIEVLAAALVADAENSTANGLRDLRLYLHAGEQFLAGLPVYTLEPIEGYPPDLGFLPFLYPPPTLPLFGVLARLPFTLTAALWVGVSVVAVVLALRAFGLSWRWTAVAFAWPPVEQGLYVGNVVVPGLILLALAVRLPAGLVLGPMLKPQYAVTALWLLRERAWRALAVGLAVVGVLIVLTLPLTGLDRWSEWINGLLVYQDSQRLLPGLYGIGLGRYLPFWLFAVFAIAVTIVALTARGREGLAKLSLASVVASPSLWSHGYLAAIPALLLLAPWWLWLAAGLVCAGPAPGPQLALAIAVAGWLVPMLRHTSADAGPHPLGAETLPWSSPRRRPNGAEPG